ncbi:hypothetical protein PAHAL_9G208500 [Panicum hallii]|uniref:Uncharacterized protein n=1 Tax=Panicum hallii TaxID=206008 RepID=A0A2T8I1X5_9POAL|nr:hypothetical protein PAHAL_9G208500 [Panicum hallii]
MQAAAWSTSPTSSAPGAPCAHRPRHQQCKLQRGPPHRPPWRPHHPQLLQAKIRKAANKLKEAAADLTQTNLKPVKLLGEALNDDAEEALKGRKSRSQLLFDLVIARKYCAEVYNQKTPLDQAN